MAGKPHLISRNRLRTGLIFGRRLFGGVVLMYALVSVLAGGSAHARWLFDGAAVLWACTLLLLPLAVRWRSARPPWLVRGGRFVHGAEVIAFNLALTLFIAECALRMLAVCSGKSLILSDALESYRLTPGQDYGDGLRGNNLGYPGEDFAARKRAGVFRIAALGDSFAVGPAVAFKDDYLTRLGKRWPDVEVYNFGVSGTGPREYRLILNTDVWRYQPDLVLVSLFVGNDITESLATPREMDPRQSALYLCVSRGVRLCREASRSGATQEAKARHRLGGAALSEHAFREIESRRLAVCFKPPSAALEHKWQRALQHLLQIIGDCRAHRVPAAFVLIPDEFQVNPHVLADALAAASYPGINLDLTYPQQRLQVFCAKQGAPCLDLLPAFLPHPDTYALRDTHWNERGNALAAGCIADWLPRVVGTLAGRGGTVNRLAGAPPMPVP
jgi:hypothetical protein